LPIPDIKEFKITSQGYERSERAAEDAWSQEVRRRWRALALAIKAKLEVVESGIAQFEEEFLSYLVLPGGETFGQKTIPHLTEIYETGKMPKLLPGPKWRQQKGVNEMSIIGLFLVLIVLGVIVWAVNTYLPLPPPFKTLILVVDVIVALIYVLNAFGVLAHFPYLSVPRVRWIKRIIEKRKPPGMNAPIAIVQWWCVSARK
jgi:hypothetical protein